VYITDLPMKLEVVGSSIFMVETELVASSKTFKISARLYIPKDEILEELRDCVTCSSAFTLLTSNG